MKIYIRSNKNYSIHLKELFDKIDSIICVDNMSDYSHSKVFGYSSINCNYYSDEELKNLSITDLHSITDFETIQRISNIDINLLSQSQREILNDKYFEHIIVDRSDVDYALKKMKACKDIYRAGRKKNRTFSSKYKMTDSDYLNIIKSLKISDYVYNTTDVDDDYLGDDLIVFLPKRTFTLKNGMKVKNLLVYIKIDIDDTDSADNPDTVAVISFHEAEKKEDYPYKNNQ